MVVKMGSYTKLAGALGAGLLALASSCAGSAGQLAQGPASQVSQLPGLGSPAALLQGRNASAAPQELTQLGSEYDPLLPSNHAAQNILALDMTAQGGSAGESIDNCAYAVYNFNAPQYEEDLRLSAIFNFGFEPQPGSFYIGVANWNENRWDWLPADNGMADFGSPAPYKRDGMGDGTILAALMLINGSVQVSQLRLGESAHPRALLSCDAQQSPLLPGSKVTFLVGVFGGSATKYEWDLDGDGVYEETGFDAAEQTYSNPGSYTARVRVTVESGESDLDAIELLVADPQT
jgi:hypothetical protein